MEAIQSMSFYKPGLTPRSFNMLTSQNYSRANMSSMLDSQSSAFVGRVTAPSVPPDIHSVLGGYMSDKQMLRNIKSSQLGTWKPSSNYSNFTKSDLIKAFPVSSPSSKDGEFLPQTSPSSSKLDFDAASLVAGSSVITQQVGQSRSFAQRNEGTITGAIQSENTSRKFDSASNDSIAGAALGSVLDPVLGPFGTLLGGAIGGAVGALSSSSRSVATTSGDKNVNDVPSEY